MPIRIVALEPRLLPAMARFSRRVWPDSRPDHEDYYRWRYLDAPAQTTLMALSGDECLAALSVFTRPYRMGGEEVRVSETADWFCLPELRGSGLGVRLMRRVAEMGRPAFAVGGSQDTRALLPRLGWRVVGRATRFVLPLTAEPLARAIRRRLRLPHAERRSLPSRLLRMSDSLLGRLLQRRGHDRPRGGTALLGTRMDPGILDAYRTRGECATLPLPIAEQVEWLGRGAAAGQVLKCLAFRIDESLEGWALLRADAAGGAAEVKLLEIFAPAPPLYRWMVAEAVSCAAELGARQVSALTACPALASALRQSGFWAREEAPIYCWGAADGFPPAPLHLGYNIGDAALLPYPTVWRTPAEARP